MRREAAACAAAFFVLIAMCIFAHAQEAAPVAVPVSNTVVVPYGDWLTAIRDYIALALVAVITWALRFLPAQLYSLLMTMRVEQLLIKAVDFGMNAVAGAAKDRKLEFQVSNAVLREALAYALLHGGPLVKKFMGGPVDVAEKLWARLPVDPEVAKPDFQKIAIVTAGDVSVVAPERARQAESLTPVTGTQS